MSDKQLVIKTTEMHTGGEPLRIIETGYPKIIGNTILEKRRYVKENFDQIRKLLIREPRGHFDMYGAILVDTSIDEADIAVLFTHNEGYSTMCGHAVIALGRYAIDKGLVKKSIEGSQAIVNIECPCGLVKSYVEIKDNGNTGKVHFHSVPAFVFAIDTEVDVEGYGKIKVDISYGGAFYAFVSAQKFGLDVRTSPTTTLIDVATKVKYAVQQSVKLDHPESPDLAFLYGTILTDGKDDFSSEPSANVCVFADRQVDRSPCGSGVTARVALQYAKKQITLNQTRTFESGSTGSRFTGTPVKAIDYGGREAVIVEVSGNAYYTGTATFTVEEDDDLKGGFLLE